MVENIATHNPAKYRNAFDIAMPVWGTAQSSFRECLPLWKRVGFVQWYPRKAAMKTSHTKRCIIIRRITVFHPSLQRGKNNKFRKLRYSRIVNFRKCCHAWLKMLPRLSPQKPERVWHCLASLIHWGTAQSSFRDGLLLGERVGLVLLLSERSIQHRGGLLLGRTYNFS